MHWTRTLSGLLTLSLLATTAACGGGGGDKPTPTDPEITAFTAAPSEATVGSALTLSWTTAHATAVSLTDTDGQAVALDGASVPAGSVEVTPATAGVHTYTLTATGEAGTTAATAQVSLTLNEAIPAPEVTSFTATPAEIVAGAEATLAWVTTGGEELEITDGDGAVVFTTTDTVADGSAVVSPSGDATYTLRVTGPGGEATASVQVTVLHPPVIDSFAATDLSGNPLLGALQPGETVRLTWETTNADTVNLTDDAGTVVPVSGVDGSAEITPAFSQTYTLVATGPDGEVSEAVTVDVIATVDSFTIAGPDQPAGDSILVRAGDEVTLAWETRGALGLTLTGPGGWTHTAEGAAIPAGNVSFAATEAGPVVLSLTPAGVVSEATVALAITESPRVRSLSVAPNPVTAGEPLEVTWVADGAALTTISATDGADGLVSVQIDTTPEGGTTSLTLPHPGAWTVTAIALNHTQEPHALSTPVTVVASPVIESFHVRPGRVTSGDAVEVSWATANTTEVRLVTTLADVATPEVVASTGTRSVVITQTTQFQLEAENALGAVVRSEVRSVEVGAPQILAFDTDNGYYQAGDTITFSWSALGGRSLEVVELVTAGDPVVHCSVIDAAAIESGSCTLTAPAASLDPYAYQLRVLDGPVEVTQDVSVQVVDGPVIRDFRVSQNVVTEGAVVTFTITADPDVNGVAPTLTLTQTGTDITTPLDLPAPEFNPEAQVYEASLALPDVGDFTFTALASSADTQPSQASVDVTVVPTPSIVAFEADATKLDSEIGPTSAVLSWSTTSVTRVEVWADGVVVLTETDPAAVGAGTLEIAPDATTHYRLIAYNAAGSNLEAEILIEVDLPQILSFVATGPQLSSADHEGHLDIVEGEPVTLSWTTNRADHVSLYPEAGFEWAETAEAFVDLAERPGAVTLFAQPVEGEVVEDLEFQIEVPEGYEPTYFAKQIRSFTVNSNGLIDLGNGSIHPFTRPLESRNEDLAAGRGASSIVWAAGADLHGRFVAVQWTHWSFDYYGSCYYYCTKYEADVSFQAFLYTDGTVRFAYGDFWSKSSTQGDGRYARIGVRSPWESGSALGGDYNDVTLSETLLSDYDTMENGLSGRTWRLQVPEHLPTDTYVFTPTSENTTVNLGAGSPNGWTDAEVTIETWPRLSEVAPRRLWFREPAQVGDEVLGFFEVRDATHAQLKVGDQVLCTVESERDLQSYCSWEPTEVGTYDLVLEYSNPVSAGTATYTIEVQPRLEILSFTVDGADTAILRQPGEVTLSWETLNADTLLLVDENATEIIPSAQLTATGSAVLNLTQSTNFILYAADSPTFDGRVRSAQVTILVNDTYVRSASLSAAQVAEGSPVTLSWDATSGQADAVYSIRPNIYWTERDQPFVSLVGDPEAKELPPVYGTFNTLDLSRVGFNFPFDGRLFSTFQVFSNGWIGFGDVGGDPLVDLQTDSNPTAIPYSSTSTDPAGFLAAYFDALRPQAAADGEETTTLFLWKLAGQPGQRTLTVEWNDWRYGTTSTYDGSLTFQALLHENGDMEIRYGPMGAVDPTGTGQKYYEGYSATVGWEDVDEETGIEIITSDQRPDLVAEGITYYFPRSVVESTGSMTFPANASMQEMEFCVSVEGYEDCRTLNLTVIKRGEVLITELMINPTAVAAGEFIELRNVSDHDVDLSGWVLEDGAGHSFTIPTMPPVPSGAYFLLAESDDPASNGGLTPDVTWAGSGFQLDDTAGTAALTLGGPFDSVTWDTSAGWTVTENASLTLQPERTLAGSDTANDAAADWCVSDAAQPYAGGLLLGSPWMTGHGCGGPGYDPDPWASDPFIDISSTGTFLADAIGDDALATTAGLGFSMPYWDTTVTNLLVSSNGWVYLGDEAQTNSRFSNYALPYSSGPGGLIAPFWDDMRTDDQPDDGVWVQTLGAAGSRVTIVQWNATRRGDSSGTADFQVQLHENGDIVFVYGTFEAGSSSYVDELLGSSATIGIETPDKTDAFMFSYNQEIGVSNRSFLLRRRP